MLTVASPPSYPAGIPVELWSIKYVPVGGSANVSVLGDDDAGTPTTGQRTRIVSGEPFRGETWGQRAVWTGNWTQHKLVIEHDVRFNGSSLQIDFVSKVTCGVGCPGLSQLLFSRIIDPDVRALPGDLSMTHNIRGYGPIVSKYLALSESHASKWAMGLIHSDPRGRVAFVADYASGYFLDPAIFQAGLEDNDGPYAGPFAESVMGVGFSYGALAPGATATFRYA